VNGKHQLLAYADYANLLGDNIDSINKNIETFIDTSKEAGREGNVEKLRVSVLNRMEGKVIT
jgi:hypothetical protein